MFIRLTDSISVAPQLAPEDCARAAAQGFTAIVNNRPDAEAAGQPASASVEAAARAAGLQYTHIPVDHTGYGPAQVDAMATALTAADGPVLAFCRSGTRSTNLWALAAAKNGGDPDTLIAAAEAGGYDIGALLPALRQLSGKA